MILNWKKGGTPTSKEGLGQPLTDLAPNTHGTYRVGVSGMGGMKSDMQEELARYCANLSMNGYIISSVTEVHEHDNTTPKVSVLTSKAYKAEIKRLMDAKRDEAAIAKTKKEGQ